MMFCIIRQSRWDQAFGQASTQRPQLIHADGSILATSSLVNPRIDEEVFVTGTSNENIENPIIGPPEISFSGSVLNPPVASTSSC